MHFITSFYHFTELSGDHLDRLQDELYKTALNYEIKGLVILASEGINCTLSGRKEAISEMKSWVTDYFSQPLFFKDSQSKTEVFRRLVIKRRDEIVTTTSPDLTPAADSNNHLSPDEWNQVLKNESDVFLVDTRNWYETKLGTFKGAIDPEIDQFTEFPEFVEKQNLSKDQKILMFCTGGIRCEKGILELQKKGFSNVYQLDGGILNYLKHHPNDEYQGECFVFDNRVAVDQQLNPSVQYTLCPHTGQPADIPIKCVRCGTETKISSEIHQIGDARSLTCSKNCAYHWQLKPGHKGERQGFSFERPPVNKDKTIRTP